MNERKTTLVVETRVDIRTLAELSQMVPSADNRSKLISTALESYIELKTSNKRFCDIEEAIVILRNAGLLKGGERFRRSLIKIQQAEVRHSEQEGVDPYDIIGEMQKGDK